MVLSHSLTLSYRMPVQFGSLDETTSSLVVSMHVETSINFETLFVCLCASPLWVAFNFRRTP